MQKPRPGPEQENADLVRLAVGGGSDSGIKSPTGTPRGDSRSKMRPGNGEDNNGEDRDPEEPIEVQVFVRPGRFGDEQMHHVEDEVDAEADPPRVERRMNFAVEDGPNVLMAVWDHDVKEGRSDLSGKKILLFDGGMLVASAISSWLYYAMTEPLVKEMPAWEAQSYLWCTYLSGITLFISSTNGLRKRFAARIMPKALKNYQYEGLPSNKRLAAEIVTMGLVSGWVSTSLVTAASRYPDMGSKAGQISWEIFIMGVNILLHMSPVEEVYSFIFRVLAGGYDFVRDRCLADEVLQWERLQEFKYTVAQKVCDKFIARLDSSVEAILHGHFIWQGCTGGLLKCMSYVRKLDTFIDTEQKLREASLVEIVATPPLLPNGQRSLIDFSKGKLSLAVSFLAYLWVFIGMAGYEIDPFIALRKNFSQDLTDSIAIPALVILWVLIGRLVGDGLKADLNTVTQTIQKKKIEVPFYGKLYTKSFALMLLLGGYKGVFATAAAEQIFRDHKADFPDFFKVDDNSSLYSGTIKSLFIYLTFSTFKSWYQDYVMKWVGVRAKNENHLIVLFQHRIEEFKQHIRLLDPDVLVQSLSALPENHLTSILGMTKPAFEYMVQFEDRYNDFQAEEAKRWYKRAWNCCKNVCLFSSGNQESKSMAGEMRRRRGPINGTSLGDSPPLSRHSPPVSKIEGRPPGLELSPSDLQGIYIARAAWS